MSPSSCRSFLRSFIVLAALACLQASIVACGGSDVSDIEIRIVSDLVPAREAATVTVALFQGVVGEREMSIGSTERTLRQGEPLARGLWVASFRGVANGTYTVWATMQRANGEQLARRPLTVTITGSASYTVTLTADCAQVECPNAGGSPSFVACLAGYCVDPRCSAQTPEFCPPDLQLFCNTDADCVPRSPCASVSCIESECVHEAISSECGEGEFCSAVSGCTPIEPPEEAPIPGEGFCGDPCLLEGDFCHYGYFVCDTSGAPVCTPLVVRPAGYPCAGGGTCDADGVCLPGRTDGGVPDASVDAGDAADAGDVVDAAVDAAVVDAAADQGVDAGIDATLADAATDAPPETIALPSILGKWRVVSGGRSVQGAQYLDFTGRTTSGGFVTLFGQSATTNILQCNERLWSRTVDVLALSGSAFLLEFADEDHLTLILSASQAVALERVDEVPAALYCSRAELAGETPIVPSVTSGGWPGHAVIDGEVLTSGRSWGSVIAVDIATGARRTVTDLDPVDAFGGTYWLALGTSPDGGVWTSCWCGSNNATLLAAWPFDGTYSEVLDLEAIAPGVYSSVTSVFYDGPAVVVSAYSNETGNQELVYFESPSATSILRTVTLPAGTDANTVVIHEGEIFAHYNGDGRIVQFDDTGRAVETWWIDGFGGDSSYIAKLISYEGSLYAFVENNGDEYDRYQTYIYELVLR